jgi:Arc/MetJ-type ribon-helix-helix transcriptional regulator
LTQQQQEKEGISVMISPDLYQSLETIIRSSGFASVDDYVNYVLRTQLGKKSEIKQEDLSDEDTESVTARLKALGYI